MFCFSVNANAAGVVLSDTAIDDDSSVVEEEETFVAPKTSNNYAGEQIQFAGKNLLDNDTSDPLFLVADNKFLSEPKFKKYFKFK